MFVANQNGAATWVGPFGDRVVVVDALQVLDVTVLIQEAQDRPGNAVGPVHLHQFDGERRSTSRWRC